MLSSTVWLVVFLGTVSLFVFNPSPNLISFYCLPKSISFCFIPGVRFSTFFGWRHDFCLAGDSSRGECKTSCWPSSTARHPCRTVQPRAGLVSHSVPAFPLMIPKWGSRGRSSEHALRFCRKKVGRAQTLL